MSEEHEIGHDDPADLLARLVRVLESGHSKARPLSSLPTPTVGRYYQATLLDLPGTGGELRAIFVPRTADEIAESVLSVGPEYAVGGTPSFLDSFTTSMYLDPPQLIAAILATRPDQCRWYSGGISDDRTREARGPAFPRPDPTGLDWSYLGDVSEYVAEIDPALYRFAARVTLEPVIPVESSPVSGTALAELVKSVGASSALGYFAVGAHPLLLITVPVGVVLLGGARGIADGLRKGLEHRIATWLGASPPSDESASAEES